MSPKPVGNPSGFPLLCCSTKCPQTCTAQRGTGMRRVLALLFADIPDLTTTFGSRNRVSTASSSLPEKEKKARKRPLSYQLSGQQRGGRGRPERWRGPGGAGRAGAPTGAWHWASPGTLKDGRRGNPQKGTSWEGRTVSYRGGAWEESEKSQNALSWKGHARIGDPAQEHSHKGKN